MLNQRQVLLRVQAQAGAGESLWVSGSIPALGNWHVDNALAMQMDDPMSHLWSVKVQIPQEQTVEFRYLICRVLDGGEKIVSRWESIVHPRSISTNELTVDRNAAIDIFGSYDGVEQVQQGWLTHETLVQLKFFNSPVAIWKKKLRKAKISFKVSPIDLVRKMSAFHANASLASMADDSEQQSNFSDQQDGRFPSVEIAVMSEGQDEFTPQEQFGHVYNAKEFVIAQTVAPNPDSLAFMIDFYCWPSDDETDAAAMPEHIGFAYLIPSNRQGSAGEISIPITGTRHHPIGELTINFLVVRPLKGYSCTAESTFAKFWKRHKRSLDVGHRGAGNARRTDIKKDTVSAKVENVLENTVASFNYAARHGADMVELDVQLSKDKVPVIYHDFHINIAMKKRRRTVNEEEPLTVAVKDLTSSQLENLKLQPAESHPESRLEFTDEDVDDNQPFPTLRHVLTAIDTRVGCNVEIKAPLQYKDGSWELDYPFDMNEYIDIILSEILLHSGNRFILLSCFHPDVCTMIRHKQNKYPLLFLTQGVTEKYPPYQDPRTESVFMASYFAKSINILGINAHTEELLKNLELISLVKSKKLIMFCWGEDINTTAVIDTLKRLGVDGVIYDKVDCLIEGDRQEIYLMQPLMASEMLEAARSCHFQSSENLPRDVSPPQLAVTPPSENGGFSGFQRPFQIISSGDS
ncbi:glycerophosphocholine phosphodiesterase GPCPD1 [Galendromus occidentalis]|uniref:Glycerophosphocholine phosphodiesterase GPCPD1 n=1 Tax=Galendromus occidentalis TaxID=34638 RepID=A0AAJ7L5U1_9ACAR|nr:glycerophosphocholine phosphodiesterase GPCPD1 [Galendromus occidentalis]